MYARAPSNHLLHDRLTFLPPRLPPARVEDYGRSPCRHAEDAVSATRRRCPDGRTRRIQQCKTAGALHRCRDGPGSDRPGRPCDCAVAGPIDGKVSVMREHCEERSVGRVKRLTWSESESRPKDCGQGLCWREHRCDRKQRARDSVKLFHVGRLVVYGVGTNGAMRNPYSTRGKCLTPLRERRLSTRLCKAYPHRLWITPYNAFSECLRCDQRELSVWLRWVERSCPHGYAGSIHIACG